MDYLYKIRFLDTVLAGRELLLREGAFTLGEEQADLLVTPETHVGLLTLNVSEKGVATDAPYPLWCNGKSCSLKPGEPLPTGVCLDLDGVRFVVGQPEDNLAQVRGHARQPVAGKRVRELFIGMTLFTMVTIFLLTGNAGALFSVASADNHLQVVDLLARIKVQLAEMAHNTRLSGVRFVWTENNVLKISGWCENETDMKDVLHFLKGNRVNYTLSLVSQSGLESNVREILQMNGFQNADVVTGDAPGKVVILGQFEQNAQWQHVTALMNDVAGLKSWQIRTVDDTELDALIVALRSAKLLSMMSVQRIDDRIILSGKLNRAQRQTLSGLMRRHMQAFPTADEIVYQNISTGAGALGVFPSPVVSVGGNSQSPYIELENGQRVQVGAHLPGGYRILSIDEDNGIELARQGELLHVPFNF